MVEYRWFRLHRAYAAYPALTIGFVAIVSVIPLAIVVIWLADEL